MGEKPEEIIKLYTVCMIADGERVLLLNRQHDSFKGYIAPGGRVDYPESPLEGAIREVKEETGLTVRNLVFKGLSEYINPGGERYMIFNYLSRDYEGELVTESREGVPEWVPLATLGQVNMQDNFRRRVPLFFAEGTFETHMNRLNPEGVYEKVRQL
ncbi:8-oxo-dGTP diphosphatase [Gorillibacterium timonense]|uniref:8-oxo-dGTP diphosphatase n=1 Tax=Gorillibacterium timonense TaxID=1689269 RepID=UPI00071D06C0|nr:8-oxo-dGTP diphosphatase [Gorillibacterium timonense]